MLRNRLLSLGLIAVVAAGVFTSTRAFADDGFDRRGPRRDPVVLDRIDVLRKLDALYVQIRELDDDRRDAPRDGHRLDDDHRDDARGRPDDRSERRPDASAHVPPPFDPRIREVSRHPDPRQDPRLRAVFLTLDDLRRTIERAPQIELERRPRAMDDLSFERLVRQIKREPFSRDKADLAVDAARNAHFSSEQIYQLVILIPFDRDQVNAAVALHGVVVDPENFTRVYEALTFRSSKIELRRRLGYDR